MKRYMTHKLSILYTGITCPSRDPPTNANVKVELTDDVNFGSVAIYTCDEGYGFVGVADTIQLCEEDPSATIAPFGNWSGSEPACQSESHLIPWMIH